MNLQSSTHDLYVHSYLGYRASIYVLWEPDFDYPAGMLVEVGRPGGITRALRVRSGFASSEEAVLAGKALAQQFVENEATRS